MNLDLLEKLEDADLRAVSARCAELLAQHDRERKEKALEQARTLLESVGLSLRDVAAGKGKSGNVKGTTYHAGKTYQHPSNKSLTWPGKGQKPSWLRDLEAQGGKPVELP